MEGEESIGQWPACSEVAAAELAVASRPSAAARTRRSVQAIFDEVRWFENLVSEKRKRKKTGSQIGWLPIFVLLKSRHVNRIWLPIGSCLRIGYFNICYRNHGKLLKIS